MWLFVYIFLLFIILTPSFLFKTKLNLKIFLMHSLLFTLIIYLTYDLVKGKNIEGNGYTLNIEGANYFFSMMREVFGRKQPINIDVNNHLATIEDPSLPELPEDENNGDGSE
tara:strand:- start:61 stop:396 length:336 start_codon:yes stop_codon:yes gene_type:complete